MPYWKIMASIFILSLGLLCLIGIPNKELAYKVIIISGFLIISSAIIYPLNFMGALLTFYSSFLPMMLYFLHFLP